MKNRTDYAFYVPSFEGGGAERNSVLLANELARRGLRVCIIVDRDVGPNRAFVEELVDVEQLGGGNHLKNITQLRGLLRRRRPGAVFVQLGLSPWKYMLATSWLPTRPAKIFVYHGIYDRAWSIGGKLAYWMAPLVCRAFDRVIAVSAGLRDHLAAEFRLNSETIDVVHNPIDLALIDRMSLAPAEVDIDGPYIISSGRMVEQKDFSTLLRAFKSISEALPHSLVILGDGPLRNELDDEVRRLGIESRVVFAGYCRNPFPILRDAASFVLSSAHEAFGNVLVEALALEKRIVSTDCPGGPNEILERGRFGVLCPVRDPEALGAAILRSLTSPHDPVAVRRRATDFDVSRIADEYVSIAAIASGKRAEPDWRPSE